MKLKLLEVWDHAKNSLSWKKNKYRLKYGNCFPTTSPDYIGRRQLSEGAFDLQRDSHKIQVQ